MCRSRSGAASSLKIGFTLLILLMPALAFGQASAAPLSFEVASIKPAETITPAMVASGKLHVGMSVQGTRVDIGYLSLAELIPIAFKLKPYQVSGPDWMSAQRFDILARMPEGATKEQMPEMLQALLAERFQLKVHRENRDHAVYALVVGKGGSKLKESPADIDAPAGDAPTGTATLGSGNSQVRIEARGRGATVLSPQGGTTKMSMTPEGQMRMEMSQVTMPAFADVLTRLTDRPVLDMTELKGNYQVALDLAMSDLLIVARASGMAVPALGGRGDGARPGEASDPSSGSIFTSVQQLGLRLESRKAPIEFVLVDHVEKMPTEN
jgi:uncharacterized protein (TIGR03435 family)